MSRVKKIFILLSSFFIILLVFFWRLKFDWPWLVDYLLAINIVTFLWYFWDKLSAIWFPSKIWRVPEIVLHFLALLGGSPAALLAQKLFKHKTSKKGFQVIYWLIIFLQIGLFFFFFQKELFQ